MGPYNKDSNILGSILGTPFFGKCQMMVGIDRIAMNYNLNTSLNLSPGCPPHSQRGKVEHFMASSH